MTYYSQTDTHPKGVYSFESDINLSNPNSTVGQVFQSFVNSQSESRLCKFTKESRVTDNMKKASGMQHSLLPWPTSVSSVSLSQTRPISSIVQVQCHLVLMQDLCALLRSMIESDREVRWELEIAPSSVSFAF